VLPPRVEVETMQALNAHFRGKRPLRIDPNARWRTETAISAGKVLRQVNLEYYEDPVRGQEAMAEVRWATKLRLSTNLGTGSCRVAGCPGHDGQPHFGHIDTPN
jgi:glucarate dehydratase